MNYDVIIIGAGPGGSTGAYYLAHAGLKVLLLDKADFPRDKTCGDGLTPRALPALADMGLLPQILAAGCRLSSELEITAPSGRTMSVHIPDMPHAPAYAVVVPRLVLDDLIRQRALNAGAIFQSDVHVRNVETDEDGVTVVSDQGRFRGRMGVIATGASTRLLSTLGLLDKPHRMIVAARAYFEDIQLLLEQFQFRFDGVPLPGYDWVFPVSKSSANIGAGFIPGARGAPLSAQSGFKAFVESPAMRRLLQNARQHSLLKSYPIRTDFATAPTFAERTLLIGEAAGLVNPLTGDGIDYALETGRIAAEHLINLFAVGNFSRAGVEAYDRLLRERYQRLFTFCERVQRLSLNRRMLNLLIPLAARYPKLPTALVNMVLGGKEIPERLSPLTILKGIASNL
ncbi:MAG: geranylgeranyl reductase family protein [Anaerolineae bacterium]|nr:geranylgeranyl reductase family protein [Anaerolineae bacterium]